MEIKTERVTTKVNGQTMGGYLAQPTTGGPHPGIIVFMEIFGINSHIRSVTERIAHEGYVALAPDYFHRTGPGVEYGYDETGFNEGIKLASALKAEEMIADARAAYTLLNDRAEVKKGKIGCIGFCIGGHMTYLTACETGVKVAASFYGGGIAAEQAPGGAPSTVGRTAKIQGRILCLFGAKDAFIPMDQVETVRSALQKNNTRHQVLVYPEADHGFFCDQRDSYHKSSADDAWERVKKLFAEELGG
jgi:carboxymethylenebutenolidase